MKSERRTNSAPTVGVFGAGAIGTFVGTLLSAAGLPVVLLGRARLVDARAQITAIGGDGSQMRLAADAIVTDDPAALAQVDVCLVCVKSGGTAAAAATLREVLGERDVRIISLQNGLGNRRALAQALRQPVSAGVVEFNVAPTGEGRYPQTVPGTLWLEAGDPRVDRVARALRRVGQRTTLHPEIERVMRGKLLINTINGVGGATGLGTRALLADRDARWCYSRCIREGLAVFAAQDEPVARVSGPGPRLLSLLLRLPDLFFRPLLALSPTDEHAVTSTVQDLRRRRTTEIGLLNGKLVALGQARGVETPINRLLCAHVRAHERAVVAGCSPLFPSPAVLRAEGERALQRSASTARAGDENDQLCI